MDCFHGNGHQLCIFCFQKPANSKQAWPECHIINYLLTYLARAVLGKTGPRPFLYRLSEARSILARPQTNIRQYGPCAC